MLNWRRRLSIIGRIEKERRLLQLGPRTSPAHGENRGSSPLGSANNINVLSTAENRSSLISPKFLQRAARQNYRQPRKIEQARRPAAQELQRSAAGFAPGRRTGMEGNLAKSGGDFDMANTTELRLRLPTPTRYFLDPPYRMNRAFTSPSMTSIGPD